jgi:hypothetical protein
LFEHIEMTTNSKFLFSVLSLLLITTKGFSEDLSITCGESKGYAYYFEGGLVNKASSGFVEDGITGGKVSLTLNDKGESDILTLDATGVVKSATSQGGNVITLPAGEGSMNWVAIYGDGTLEVYSYNGNSNSVASYRNTVGNTNIAKNSIFISDCD